MKILLHHKNFFHDFKDEWRIDFANWSHFPEEISLSGYTSSSVLDEEAPTFPEMYFLFTELLAFEGLRQAKEDIRSLKARCVPLIVLIDLSKNRLFAQGPQSPNESLFNEKDFKIFFARFKELESFCGKLGQKIAYQPQLNTGIQNFTDIEMFLQHTDSKLVIDTAQLLYLKIFDIAHYLSGIQTRLDGLILQDYDPSLWTDCRKQKMSYLRSVEANMFRHPTNSGLKLEKIQFLFNQVDYLVLAGEQQPHLNDTKVALRTSLALLNSISQAGDKPKKRSLSSKPRSRPRSRAQKDNLNKVS